jgi:hypothetical protein
LMSSATSSERLRPASKQQHMRTFSSKEVCADGPADQASEGGTTAGGQASREGVLCCC